MAQKTTVPKVARFEKEFAEYVGAEYALAVNSATAGLHLALEAAGIGPGDLVVTTPYTFTATAEVVRYLGADPVFVDIVPDTFNIDIDLVLELLMQRRKDIKLETGRFRIDFDMLTVKLFGLIFNRYNNHFVFSPTEVDMKKNFPVIVEQDEDGVFIVECPSIKGCRSYGYTIEEAMENIREAIEACLDSKDITLDSAKFLGWREVEVALP